MTLSEFFSKFKSKSLWANLLAMVAVVVVFCFGFKLAIDVYTHHGESIAIPNIIHKDYNAALQQVEDLGLKMEVTDTGYVRTLPPGCILEQFPASGEHVKSGHVIYVTINASKSPTITLPDVIDNCSLREAMARLKALGFKVGTPQYVPGEADWVYGILVNGRNVSTGDKISVDATLIIQVGNGQRDANDSVDYIEPEFDNSDEGDVDNFEEVTTPPVEEDPFHETTQP